MQRLFSMFPSGLPGFGLLLLRMAVAATLIAQSGITANNWPHLLLSVTLCIIALALCLGLFTPFISLIAALLSACIMLGYISGGFTFAAMAFPVSIALCFLGPGSYSIDAYLYGRQVLVMPSDHNGQENDPD